MRIAIISLINFIFAVSGFAATPANPNASNDAKKILNYFADLPNHSNKRVVSGEFAEQGTLSSLYSATGYWVGMIGNEYSTWGAAFPAINWSRCNPNLKDYWNNGGLVTVTAHMHNPTTQGDAWDVTAVNATRLLTPGTSENTNYMQMLDLIAEGLADLQDAGVVVLWRPLHEMNGSWFWWGGVGSASFKAIWQHMFNYFTTTKGLNNLLWIYSPNYGAGGYSSFYPGSQYVDMVGLDTYTPISSTTTIDGYSDMIALGKPFGISEFGPGQPAQSGYDFTQLIGAIKNRMPLTTWFLTWNASWSIARGTNGSTLLADSWVINRPDVAWNSMQDMVATPAISPAGGIVSSESQTVTITCGTSGATIYYTTNGNDPTASSPVYNGPFVLSSSATVKAMAVKSGLANSSIASVTYVFSGSGNLALYRTATASTTEGGSSPANAVDGDGGTRWASQNPATGTEWFMIDLGSNQNINYVVINWETAFASGYQIQTSTDGSNWSSRYSTATGDGGSDEIPFTAVNARYVRVYMTTRGAGNTWGYSLYELEVYGGTSDMEIAIAHGANQLQLQNNPNPFNPITNIVYDLERGRKGMLEIFDLSGKIVSRAAVSGRGAFTWNASGLASGIYMCRLRSGNSAVSKRMILAR